MPADRLDRGPAPAQQLRLGHLLHRLDRPAAQRPAGRQVADAGDLRLVRHHPDQPEPRPVDQATGQGGGLRGRVDRGAAYAHVQRPGLPGRVEVEAQAY